MFRPVEWVTASCFLWQVIFRFHVQRMNIMAFGSQSRIIRFESFLGLDAARSDVSERHRQTTVNHRIAMRSQGQPYLGQQVLRSFAKGAISLPSPVVCLGGVEWCENQHVLIWVIFEARS